MSAEFTARCGIKCGECEYREKFNCPGCLEAAGKIFWGECPVAHCNMEKGKEHCGECGQFVCELLHSFAYDPEQGDNGQRIENLKARMVEENKN